MSARNANKQVKRWLLFCGLLFVAAGLLAVIVISGQQILERQGEYRAARREYIQLREQVMTVAADDDEQMEGIDFDALSAINPNTVGWITVPGTSISYPVVQASDNYWYLRRTFHGARNASGTVFIDYRDASDFSGHVRVYAHNMRDGSMFAPLLEWGGDMFIIHTLDGCILTYTVLSRGAAPVTGDVFSSTAEGVLLVTCVNGQPDVRFVVWARLENEESR